MKFKVGDKIIGTSDNVYLITKTGWIGTVIETSSEKIRVVGKDITEDDRCWVNEAFFELYDKSDNKCKITFRPQIHGLFLYSIGYKVEFNKDDIKIGCRTLSLEDALTFVKKFNELYEVKD